MRPGPKIKLSTETWPGTELAVLKTDALYTVLYAGQLVTLRLTGSSKAIPHKYPPPAWSCRSFAQTRVQQLNEAFRTNEFSVGIIRSSVAETVL